MTDDTLQDNRGGRWVEVASDDLVMLAYGVSRATARHWLGWD